VPSKPSKPESGAARFTPGPWERYQSAEHAAGWGWIINARNGEDFICEVSSNGQTMVELAGNSNLIAAAPDMYEALVAYMFTEQTDAGRNPHREGTNKHRAFELARAALARARGE